MKQENEMNTAQIRAVSVQIEQVANNIQSQALLLREKFDELYGNLQFADLAKDVAFDRYMCTLARAKSLCEVMPSLAYQAREMQCFGLPQVAEDITHLSRITPAPAPILTTMSPSVSAVVTRVSV